MMEAYQTSLNPENSCRSSLLGLQQRRRDKERERGALYHRRHGVILLEQSTRYAFFLLARQHSAPHKYL